MANLSKSTRMADAAREECLCVRSCAGECAYHGQWHTHAEEACPLHPERVVDGAP